MAASKWVVYHNAKRKLLAGDIDLDGGAIRMKLCLASKSAAVQALTRSLFASLTHITTNLNPAIRTVSNISLRLSSNSVLCFDSDPVVFSASGGPVSCLYAVIGVSNGHALAYCQLTSTSVVTVTDTNTLTITPAATGYFTLSGGATE